MTRHRWQRQLVRVGPWLKAARAAVDVNDRFFFGGLLVAARGGWMVSPRWTLVAGGIVLMAVGLTGLGGSRGNTR